MRGDLKIAVFISAVLIVVIVVYFAYRRTPEQAVALNPSAGTGEAARATESGSQPPVKPGGDVASRQGAGPTQVGGGNQAVEPVRRPVIKAPATPQGSELVSAESPGQSQLAGESSERAENSSAAPRSLTGISPDPSGNGTEGASRPAASPTAPGTGVPAERIPATPVRTDVGTPPAAAKPTTPAAAAFETHRTVGGETFASLARMYYGSERYTAYLAAQNSGVRATGPIPRDTIIQIPPRPTDEDLKKLGTTAGSARGTAGTGARTYKVQSGDTFYGIAEKVLGDSSRWRELLELNRQLVGGDPTNLQVGQELKLPER